MIHELLLLNEKMRLIAAVKVIQMQAEIAWDAYFDRDSKLDLSFTCPGCGENLHFVYGMPKWQSPWSKDWRGYGPIALAHTAPRHTGHPSEVVPNEYWLIDRTPHVELNEDEEVNWV